MKSGFLDKLMARLDRMDPDSLQTQFLHLARERGLMETIFNAIQEGVVLVDAGGRLGYANHSAGRMLGFEPADAAGQPLGRYLRGIDWNRVLDLDEGEWSRLVSREIEISYPERRFLSFYVVPLSAVNPAEQGAVVILRDVTRNREDQAKTVESERLSALTLLAAGVAHEIGNPLNSLTIHLQLLDREIAALGPEHRENLGGLLRVTRQEVERLDQIINQFLRAVRPTTPVRERASLTAILEETLAFLKHEIRNRDVLVEVDAPRGLPRALVDRNQIKQAFFNIIRNAIQAMAEGGLLKIEFWATERMVGVSFKDTGPGIAPEHIGNLFEPYRTTKPEGSGLGLMIVQRIVRDHGGQVEVLSEPGAGTAFTLLLPRDDRRVRLLKAPRAAEPADREAAP